MPTRMSSLTMTNTLPKRDQHLFLVPRAAHIHQLHHEAVTFGCQTSSQAVTLITAHSRWHNASAFIHSCIHSPTPTFSIAVHFSRVCHVQRMHLRLWRLTTSTSLKLGPWFTGRLSTLRSYVGEDRVGGGYFLSANQPSLLQGLQGLTLARFPIEPGYNLLLKVMFVCEHVTHWMSPKSHTPNPPAVIVGVATQYTQFDLFQAQASTFWLCFGCKRSKTDDVKGDIVFSFSFRIHLLAQPNTQHRLVWGILVIRVHREKMINLNWCRPLIDR